MSTLWWLTRTETVHRVYDALKVHGLTAAQMDEHVADATAADTGRDSLSGVEIRAPDPAETRRFEGCCDVFSGLRNDETAACAFDTESGGGDGEGDENGEVADPDLVSYLFPGDPGLAYHIHPLKADVTFPGGYVRRVFVVPKARNRGIATALVSRTVTVAGERGTETVHMLVARDNRPSQRIFESISFRVTCTRAYYRVGPWRHRRVKPHS